MPKIIEATDPAINQAAISLRQGKLVAFPTETVYGLGADATSDRAVASIYAAKGRPTFNPLIIHFADLVILESHVHWNNQAQLLADQFWPGPLTLVLSRSEKSKISLLSSAGLDTLAVRIPSHPVAQKLLRSVGIPIAAPSANASGKLSPTTPLHVAESLGNNVDLILAAGRTTVGLESTVLDLSAPRPTILRPGGITREQIERLIGAVDLPVAVSNDSNPVAPGMLSSHYAPNIPLRMNVISAEPDEGLLLFGADTFVKGGLVRLNLSEQGDLNEAAANLFFMLRQLDQQQLKGIAVMPIPETGLGVAINDRLKRASH